MAAEAAVGSSIADNKTDKYSAIKMKTKHKNGVILDKSINISTYLETNEQRNGHERLTTQLNGFYTHIQSGKVSPHIRASSLRASPVRNKSMSVPNLDTSNTEIKGKNR
jgi:hypothetical protein